MLHFKYKISIFATSLHFKLKKERENMLTFPRLHSDNIGIFSSTLCLIHCIATPFLFVAMSCTASCCAASPFWWQLFDLIFLLIAFPAVLYASQQSNKRWVSMTLYTSWIALALVILNEHLLIVHLWREAIYIPSLLLIGTHFYNRNDCQYSARCCAS